MPSKQTASAVRIARSLSPAEQAMNEATLRMLALGTEVLRARTQGGFHPIEGQQAVDGIGRAPALLFGALREMVRLRPPQNSARCWASGTCLTAHRTISRGALGTMSCL